MKNRRRAWKIRSASFNSNILVENQPGNITLDYGIQGLKPEMARKEIEHLVRQSYQGSSEKRISAHIGQIYRILNEIVADDIIVAPIKKSTQFCIGSVELKRPQIRGTSIILSATWLRVDIPIIEFQLDLRYSFMAIMKICEVKRNNAPSRLHEIAAGKVDPGY